MNLTFLCLVDTWDSRQRMNFYVLWGLCNSLYLFFHVSCHHSHNLAFIRIILIWCLFLHLLTTIYLGRIFKLLLNNIIIIVQYFQVYLSYSFCILILFMNNGLWLHCTSRTSRLAYRLPRKKIPKLHGCHDWSSSIMVSYTQ